MSFIALSLCALSSLSAVESGDIQVTVSPPWTLVLSVPGKDGTAVPQQVAVDPPDVVAVRDEEHGTLPVWNPNGAGYSRGAGCRQMVTAECSAAGTLVPGTVRIKSGTGDAAAYAEGRDYALDPFWGRFGRIETSTVPEGKPVYVDYSYVKQRLDRVVIDASGKAAFRRGTPAMGVVLPPELKAGDKPVVNVWISGPADALGDDNLFPVTPDLKPALPESSDAAEKLLPNTLRKLRSGEKLTLVAWGDSVTAMGVYQNQFVAKLKERFPKADINLITSAWPGRGSRNYLEAPAGGEKDFVRDVLDPKPDVAVMEWVNDAYLDEAGVQSHYGGILSRLRGVGAEVIILTPHLVRPDWMDMKTLKFDEDPRPYVKGLRRFAAENNVALADASRLWCQSWRRGLPYIAYLENSINHPDVRGHALFTEALMSLFPEE
jgi:lysophospholipase L1-like esterase